MIFETWVAYVDRPDGTRDVIDVRESWELDEFVFERGAALKSTVRKSRRAVVSLTVDILQAAGMLNVSSKTVRREINRGTLRALRIGKVWRLRVTEIEAYLKRLEDGAMGGC